MCSDPSDASAVETTTPHLGRRSLLTAAAATAATLGVAAGATSAQATGHGHSHSSKHRVPRDRISIQLYTLRDQLAADLEGTIAALADIGYRRVEHAGFVGRTAEEFKAITDAHHIWVSSGHVGIPQPFDATTWAAALDDARTLRSRYIVHPFYGVDGSGAVIRDTATWTAFAHDLNRAGRMARQAGLRFGYHNHHFEFFRLADNPRMTAYDVLIEETDPRYVHFETDLFWVTRGARDPVDLLHRLHGRARQFHVKDMNQDGSFEDLGKGLIDFPRIFRESRPVDEYIVERDDAGTAPRSPADALDTAQVGYDYLANVRF